MKPKHIKSARKARPEYGIEVGDSYYMWKLPHGDYQYSKEEPNPSQLITSPFMSELYSIVEAIEKFQVECSDDYLVICEIAMDRLDTLIDKTRDKCTNMPESLQRGNTGKLMRDRIDALVKWSNLIYEMPNPPKDLDEWDLVAKKFWLQSTMAVIQGSCPKLQ